MRPASERDLEAVTSSARESTATIAAANSRTLSVKVRPRSSSDSDESLDRPPISPFFAHAVGETNDDIKALIASVAEIGRGGFLLPTRNNELFRWCLQHGLRLVHQMTLMTTGLYNEPIGAYLPSVLY